MDPLNLDPEATMASLGALAVGSGQGGHPALGGSAGLSSTDGSRGLAWTREAAEVLALSKMNWNNTDFAGALPITLRAARQVRAMLRHVGGGDSIQARYAFYM